MNTRASMAWRDRMGAGALAFALVALLFAWSPSLHPGFAPPRLAPPTITYSPAALTAGDHQEYYDEWNAAHSPALIALSAAMMLPPVERGQTNAVTPPLDAAYSLLRFPDTSNTERERYDQIPMLTLPRPMSPLEPQHLMAPVPIPANSAIGTQSPSPAPQPYRMELTGDLKGRTVDLSPMAALSDSSGSWSFTAVLRYDENGQVQHALLESAALNQPLRDEVARRLYQCRVTPSGAPGEGRLTVYGPGRASRP